MPSLYPKDRGNLIVFVAFTLLASLSEASINLTVSPSGPVEVNQRVTIQCSFGSYPLSAIFFTKTNPEEAFCDLSTDPGAVECKTTACSLNYTATCPNDRTYSLVYPVPQSWNGKGVYCKGLFTGDEESNQINFSVIVLVTSVTLTPTQITVDAGKQINLTCQTDYCNPAANITWYKSSTSLTTPTTDPTDTDSNGLVGTTSVLQYTGVVGDNGQQVYCRASNRPGKHVESNKYILDIRYPPSSDPVITATPLGLQYNTGTRVTLTCQLSGGNPVATLSWRCKNTVIVGTNGSNSTTAVSVLSLVMGSSYNNQQCTCTANHRLLTSPKSRSVSLTVFYNNVITSNWNQTYSIKEHERFQLVCEVDGNPLSNITWVFVRNNSVIKKFHNVKNTSLEISSANCLDYGTYEVLADNGIGPTVRKTANLLVNCKPRLYPTDSLTPVEIGIENNDSLQIFVRILLFPPATQTTWNFSRKTNESKVIRDSIDGYRITHRNGNVEQNTTLYKKTVDTEEFGIYTFRVENEVGIFTRIYHVDSAGSPLIPTNITLLCENSMSIKISWISNFNGGDDQSFQVSYSTDGYLTESYKVLKTNIDDKGNGRPHSYIPSIELQGRIWFTITASNKFGNTTSDAVYCNAAKLNIQGPESNVGGIIGGTFGGVILVVLVVLLIFITRKYQIRCIERKPNSSGKKTEVSDNTCISETLGLRAEKSAQYEELNKDSRDQENSYDAITSPNKNRPSGATYEDLQPQKEENKYEEFTGPTSGKESAYTNSKMLSTANVYVNMSFK